MSPIKLAIIDDGINQANIPPGIIYECHTADKHGVKPDTPLTAESHGSACYSLIQKNTSTPHKLISIAVLDHETGTGNHMALLSALKWCAGQNIDLINMSIGTRQFSDFAAIAEAIGNLPDTIIVAACSNQNELTFPACLPSVIGVRHCDREELRGKHIFIQNPYDQIEVKTNAADENDYGSNSHAAPIITARCLDLLHQGYRGIDAIRQKLKTDAITDTGFVGKDFYKGLSPNWSEVESPIVAIVDDGIKSTEVLKKLLSMFMDDGYRAAALSANHETSAGDFIFRLFWSGTGEAGTSELIELYYNFILPDILFLHMNYNDIISLSGETAADVIIGEHLEEHENVICLSQPAEVIFERIKNFFV